MSCFEVVLPASRQRLPIPRAGINPEHFPFLTTNQKPSTNPLHTHRLVCPLFAALFCFLHIYLLVLASLLCIFYSDGFTVWAAGIAGGEKGSPCGVQKWRWIWVGEGATQSKGGRHAETLRALCRLRCSRVRNGAEREENQPIRYWSYLQLRGCSLKLPSVSSRSVGAQQKHLVFVRH